MAIFIEQLMAESRVPFGTSGARGLVVDMTDRVCSAYALAFTQYLTRVGRLAADTPLAIGGDRRPSTPRILGALHTSLTRAGRVVENHGLLPSPALALAGLERRMPTIMVTGSHIPADRNGMKFTTESGEITKGDEAGIRAERVELGYDFDASGGLVTELPLPEVHVASTHAYVARYLDAFPKGFLSGLRIGVYGHSAVGRDVMVEILAGLGADVVPLGFSETFIPVDTEAIRDEDVRLAKGWAKEHELDALVSTDGDSDRPLVADERGHFLRGDVAGVLVAMYFGANAVAAPVSCNGVLELSGKFAATRRTKIGSPYVIAGMEALANAGSSRVVGYEANGGFLHQSPLEVPGGGILRPLPTRDPLIVHLGVFGLARQHGIRVSELMALLPPRTTASGRDTSFATARSSALLARLAALPLDELASALGGGQASGENLGEVIRVDTTDGLRVLFASGEVIHLRPSGNAPELRCYAEAETEGRAAALVKHGLERAHELA